MKLAHKNIGHRDSVERSRLAFVPVVPIVELVFEVNLVGSRALVLFDRGGPLPPARVAANRKVPVVVLTWQVVAALDVLGSDGACAWRKRLDKRLHLVHLAFVARL